MLDIGRNGTARETELEGLILVCIVGSDQRLANDCRANLERLCPGGYHMQECESSDASGGCDIYIWDFDSSPALPSAMVTAFEATKVVIVAKSSISSLRRELADCDFTYLQSPVTPLSLRAVLESATARLQLRVNEGKSLSRLKLDRDRILQQLLETNLKLREHDQDRTNFLTRAIHDIRVPLTAIQGYCDLLLDGELGPLDPEQSPILVRMQRNLTKLCRLVGSMMDLGTGLQGTDKMRLEPASIEACVQQAVQEILLFVEKKQISLELEIEPPDGTLVFDTERLEQVLVNLLDNACKFTPEGGSITVRGRSVTAQGLDEVGLGEATAGYRIDIKDTGRGIDPDLLEQVFDEHTCYGNAMDRSGSGLGLAICRMIIQAHNGRIWADSSTQGASFSLVLPQISTILDVAI
jgi:signal transduction histidine kinase